MGSVLLRTPGPGAASSYRDLDDYIETTGFDPLKYNHKASGMGMKSLSDKLMNLNITKPIRKPRKNITMSM